MNVKTQYVLNTISHVTIALACESFRVCYSIQEQVK